MPAFSIAILAIGDDRPNGGVKDIYTGAVAQNLARHGYPLRCALAVPNQEKEICAALNYLAQHVSYVIVTGGHGATIKDLAARAAARALNQALVINDKALEQIHTWFQRHNRELEPHTERQALLPQEATVLPNPQGIAPGFRIKQGDCELFFLPGDTAEMSAVFEQSVLPRLRRRAPRATPIRATLKCFGLTEAKIKAMLPFLKLPQGVVIEVACASPLVLIELEATGADARRQLDRTLDLLQQELNDYLMARDDESPAANIGHLLRDAGLSLALAESCTGGLIASLLTSEPGASSFLERGGVTYANSAKADWLGVPDAILHKFGAVSAPCARAMARGLRERSGTDLALAVTGIAGPDGGSSEKPVGTVYLALASSAGVQVQRYHFRGTRHEIQHMSAYMGLEWLRRYTLQLPAEPTPSA